MAEELGKDRMRNMEVLYCERRDNNKQKRREKEQHGALQHEADLRRTKEKFEEELSRAKEKYEEKLSRAKEE